MQDHDDRPAGAGRPSLLSSASQADLQAEPDRQRILSSLDSGAARAASARSARKARPHARGWMWAAAAAAGAVAVALAVFVSGEGDEQVSPEAVHAAATPEARPAAVGPAATDKVAAASAPAGGAAPADGAAHVAAAAVAPAPAPAPAVPAPGPGLVESVAPAHPGREAAPANPLADMAPTTVPDPARASVHARTPAADPLTRALEHKPARHAATSKPEREANHAAVAKAKPTPKPARQRAHSEPDSDVLLLAALMSHIEPRNKKATLSERLDACKRYNSAGEEQCRARVCDGAERKEPACKGAQGARARPES